MLGKRRPPGDDWRELLRLLSEAAGLAFTLWYLWVIAVPPGAKITIKAELAGVLGPWTEARSKRLIAREMWTDVIHLQTFGVEPLRRNLTEPG